MPLYRRKPFPLLENPDDLKPVEKIFQVRFTKEIFRDYSEYLNRLNLYRQRVWTCKVTGKINLTYEEALVSEQKASEKVQQFPEKLVEHVLRDIQFSMLTLKDLVNKIASNLQEQVLEGSELHASKNNKICPCKIVKVIEDVDSQKTRYEVAWLDEDRKITSNDEVVGEDLIKKKLPFTREYLKSFVRESTYRSAPWVLHNKLALRHGISRTLPKDLEDKVFLQDGLFVNITRKRKKTEDDEEYGKYKLKKTDDEEEEEAIKYPIEDLLVPLDPVLTERPALCYKFNVPMDCVGDLLMVWDFCSSFGKFLNLWPFSLEDFENALCHKESNVVLIVECYSAFLLLLMKDNNGDYSAASKKKKRKPKISLVTWTDYLCDFLELNSELSAHMSTIRRGHYGLLATRAKLEIFTTMLAQLIETDIFREKLHECIEERQRLAATKREEALEEGRKRREDKEQCRNVYAHVSGGKIQSVPDNNTQNTNNGSFIAKDTLEKSANNHSNGALKKNAKKQNISSKNAVELNEDSSTKGDANTESPQKMSKEERKEYFEREMEKRFVRTSPLGKDKNYNRYWIFQREARIFVENSDSNEWGYCSTKEELDDLMGSLNEKGEREQALKKQFEKCYDTICTKLQNRCDEASQGAEMEESEVRRSTRVRAPPRENPSLAFRSYVNKWKED